MIVEGQRSYPVHDLVEEILRMDLLHDLSVDPIAYTEKSNAIDPVNGRRQHRRDARHQASILAIEVAARREQGNGAPGPAAPADGSDQHVALDRRMGVADVSCQHPQVPGGALWQREEEVGLRMACAERGDAAVRGPEE